MKQLILSFSILIFLVNLGFAQDDKSANDRSFDGIISSASLEEIKINEDSLGFFAFLIVNDSLPEERFFACHQFIPKLVQTLKHKNSFHYPFEQLKTISIQYPADSTFRIFTWQLFVDNDTYKYYGAIQMNTPDLKLIPLVSRPDDVEAPEFEVLQSDKWFGALYYNIIDFQSENKTKYLLTGYQQHDFFTKRKILDVLSFQNEKPIFGDSIFVRQNEYDEHPPTKNRMVLNYYAGASIKLNYDEVHDVILFDHLIDVVDPDGIKRLPDGSYEGYRFVDEKWQHVVKMFDQVFDEPPLPETPVNESSSKRDILGRKK